MGLMMKIVMFISKGLLTTVLAMTFFTNSFSQGFKVKEFKQIINDGSAFRAPMDVDGHPCGLVKVRTDDEELKFKGDIVGEIENKTNEYWVFMAQGSKSLNILHPNYLPITVDFAALGIDEVASKATYILTLSEQKFKKEKCGLVTTVKPEIASLFINDVLIENISGNGLYQLYLPKGDYVCRIEQKGFRPNVQAVTIGKGTQNLNIELESLMSELEVKCKTSTAEIYVDGEKKGNGSWKGPLYAGDHIIEARQQNFESNCQTISIGEKESRTIIVPELKRSMGKWEIETMPKNLPVMVDGEDKGYSPLVLDIETGKHYVMCKSYGCSQQRIGVDVNSDVTSSTIIKLNILGRSENDRQEVYEKAYTGDQHAIVELICLCLCGVHSGGEPTDSEEAVFWMKRLGNEKDAIRHWIAYKNQENTVCGYDDMISALCKTGDTDNALYVLSLAKSSNQWIIYEYAYKEIGDVFLKKKVYDKAIHYYEEAEEFGYEGLGDCYVAKGNMQLAASYYRKCLSLDNYDGKNRVEKKLKALGN